MLIHFYCGLSYHVTLVPFYTIILYQPCTISLCSILLYLNPLLSECILPYTCLTILIVFNCRFQQHFSSPSSSSSSSMGLHSFPAGHLHQTLAQHRCSLSGHRGRAVPPAGLCAAGALECSGWGGNIWH